MTSLSPTYSEPIQRVVSWLLAQRSPQGVLQCPEHKIEHTGKNAGLVVMACELYRLGIGDGKDWFALAEEQALRLASRLEREGDSTCWTFRPGRHDPFNASNNVIDGGACSDALGTFLELFGERLSQGVHRILKRACVLHAQTYLRYAAFDKDIAAQRAWALTGVAQAWRQVGHGVLEYATVEGARALCDNMHSDGSFAYHGVGAHGGDTPAGALPNPGAADVSSFYQSRTTAFLLFALDAVGQDPTEPRWREPLEKQLEFLAALYGPDGIKVGNIEAKPWYHGANYEVASHPFDVFALARGARLFGLRGLGRVAWSAWKTWVDHLSSEGRPQDHFPQAGRRRSYQCPTFWAGHSMWMARALEDLQWIEERGWHEPEPWSPGGVVTHFPQANLVRLEGEYVVAWIRGARLGGNMHHGSPHGAGVLRAVDKQTGAELFARCPFGTRSDGEWYGREGWLPRPLAAFRCNGSELRFSLWLARNAYRRLGLMSAMKEPLRVLKTGLLAFASPKTSSAWFQAPTLEMLVDGVRLESGLAFRDGTPAGDAVLVRTFRVTEGKLVVEEVCRPGSSSSVRYVGPKPSDALSVQVSEVSS